jgi:hypothetical protein
MNRSAVAGFVACIAFLGLSLAQAAWAAPVPDRGWKWEETGRRDPFAYRALVDSKPPPKKRLRKKPKWPIDEEQPPMVDLEALIGEAREAAEEARDFLESREFDSAASAVRGLIPQLERAGLDSECEALLRLYDTAARLKARAAAERAFGELGIAVNGIIWEETGAAVALVSQRSSTAGSLVRKGDVVRGARIEEIRPGEVVFRFNGVSVRDGVLVGEENR